MPDSALESSLLARGCRTVAGVDEVGRGAWAGPVSVGVALVDLAGVEILPAGLDDSKALSPRAREALYPLLARACRAFAVGHASPNECDALGMTAAQELAARRALAELGEVPDAVIVDGRVDFTGHPRAVLAVGADRTSLSVAAASVLAKVTRDRLLVAQAERYPGYGLERHKGYPTLEHRRAVARLGLTAIHRRSWAFARPIDPGGA
ncbi:MAG TPA: ribonuclease HII [Acidimicrobiales bacterium]|nr:ribonuclease HII [Acidimicrobiales bacterium]